MASTYSNLKIQLMATGENSGTWGNVTNVNLGTAIEQAMVESATVTFSSANVTLTLTDTNAAQNARALRLNLTGTTGGARDLIVPAIQKPYIVNNGTADTITVKVSGQTGIAVPASKTMLVYNNGTDVVDAINHLSALSLTTALPIASGGTGSNTATFSGENITSLNASNISSGTLGVAQGGTGATTLTSEAVVIGNTTGAVKFVSPGTDGNVLTSNGTAWVSEAIVIPPSVPTGTIAAFAGDPGAGWLECNGQVVSQSTYSDLYAKVGLQVDGMQNNSVNFAPMTLNNQVETFLTMAYGNGTYVLGSYHDSLSYLRNYTSTDAVTWTARSNAWPGTNNGLYRIIYTDKFIASAVVSGTAETNRNSIFTSTDGITWTTRTFALAGDPTSLTYDGSNLIVASSNPYNAVPSTNICATSTDGITWTARTGAVATTNNTIAFGNGVYVCAGQSTGGNNIRPVIQTSTDAITWTFRSTAIRSRSFRKVVFDGAKFWGYSYVGGNENVSVQTSTDGITWTANTVLPRFMPVIRQMSYDSTLDILWAAGQASNMYDDAGFKVCISKDKGVTWQIGDTGAFTESTTTDTQNVPAGLALTISSSANSIGFANGRMYLAGYKYTLGTGGTYFQGVAKVALPYTYQTDTQFVVPWGHPIGTSGNMNPSFGGVKSSVVTNGLSGGVKYYIKT